ncbi:UCP10 [Sanghuangporus vaninii]
MNTLAKLLGSLVRIILYPLTSSLSTIQRLFLYFYTWLPSSNRRNVAGDPASVADRWVRELEEETGAIRESRLSDDVGVTTASGADAQAGPGPSTLSRRTESARAHRAFIPEFYLGSYESALRESQKDTRLFCVVLVSEEHEDVPEFKRTALIDPEFNKILRTNDFIVWGGDVRDYEAFQAAQKLGATTYPFVAFVGVQPRRGSQLSEAPILTVLSRHQGPSTPNDADLPASELGPTSPRALCLHLTNSLLPRVTPFLARLRAATAEREAHRRLREEQDAAFARAAEEDRLRIARKQEEERRQREEIEMQELAHAREEAERRRVQEEREAREANRLLWYRYARRTLLKPDATPGKDSIRIGVRFPDGRLQVRHFASSDSVTSLYVFVASQLISKDLLSNEDPTSPPPGFASSESGISEEYWSFKLALAYPRREVPWSASTPLSTIDGLKGGAQLVLETIPGRALVPGSTQNQGDDGDSDYDTEEE